MIAYQDGDFRDRQLLRLLVTGSEYPLGRTEGRITVGKGVATVTNPASTDRVLGKATGAKI